MEEAKKARTTAKGRFTRDEKSLSDALKVETLPLATLERRFKDLKSKWDLCQETHDNYALFAGEMEAAEADGLEIWIEELSERFNAIEIIADEMSEVLASKGSLPSAAKEEIKFAELGSSCIVKIEKLKFPTFNGDLRRYPQFKQEFLRHIAPQCSNTQLAIVLKGYLSSDIRVGVENCGEDYNRIWERLDMRYGNVQKLVDLVLNDIKKMPCSESDDISTIAMIETVERAHQDLIRMDAEIEMSNSTIISEVERRMPPKMKDEWAAIVTKSAISTSNRFYALLGLLGDWRRKLEYLNDSIRADTSDVHGEAHHLRDTNQSRNQGLDICWYHDLEGANSEHPIFKCRMFKSLSVEARIKLMKENKVCLVCLEKSCPGESGGKCKNPRFKCRKPGCEGKHHHTLHSSGSEEAVLHANDTGMGETLLLTQEA